ncbi:WD40 repeat domain-containing serine/threonine-protein kinase [Fortiea contorta]|uniref:WD40 repeat domain-containing serine/threonine-protein kinase n=1 Tax=Fortiea contorta TaxID=1892405 RepID=UPI00034D2881|nr:WD40 repeat domain-containing serine/threonine-protein kinase [Fortiea contorta]
MIYCLNPSCNQPLNADGAHFCQSCGTKLIPLLRDRYQIIQSLGGGGFGRTFLATDEDKLKARCVVKQLAPQVQGTKALYKATELFQEEAQRLEQLGEHPQIPTLYAYFEQDHYLYLVQQFIQGQSLKQELQQQGIFSEEKIWQLLRELLPVLKFVHENQVIHRDIKPDNIMRRSLPPVNSFYPQGERENLVLIDFGVAKHITVAAVEHTGTSIGSHGYAPMEQMKYGFAYPASDLFSLGVTCFSLLTGIHPSHLYMEQGYSWVTNWQANLHAPISVKLQHVLNKLLQKELEYRYQSADEVLQDLDKQPQNTTLFSKSGRSPVAHATVIQSSIQIPKKLILGGAVLLLGLGGYMYWQGLPLNGHTSEVNSLSFRPLSSSNSTPNQISASANTLASGSDDQTVKIWNLQQKRAIRTLKGHSGKVYAVAISPDGKNVVSGSIDKTIKIWNLNTGKEIRTLKGHQSLISSLAISPDGKTIVSVSYDKTIKIWNLNTGKEIRTLTGHSAEILAVAISPNGEKIVSGSADRTIKIWDFKTGKEIRTIPAHKLDVNALAISPNGQLLLSSSDDRIIKLWNLNTGKAIRAFEGHLADVNAIAFHPLGESFATASDDKTVKLWNLNTGQIIHIFTGHTAEVYAIAFSPDGKILVSGSKDKAIRIWPLAN